MRSLPTRSVSLVLLLLIAFLVGFLVVLSLHPSLVRANDTAVGGVGGDVYPLGSTDIRLEAETVQAVCYRGFAEYRVDFRFVNEGDPQVVRLGFPFAVTVSGDLGNAPVAFRAWQDGRPLAVTLGQSVSPEDLMFSDAPLGYYLHEATFPRGETMITVSYLAQPTVTAGSRFFTLPEFEAVNIYGWSAQYDYWLHTGAGWAGSIGKAVVRFRLADTFNGWALDIKAADVETYVAQGQGGGSTTSPESYVKLDDRTYQWIFEDLEPAEGDDILLAFTYPGIPWDTEVEYPPMFGALATPGSTSEPREPDSDVPPGWEAIDRSPGSAWKMAAPGAGGWIRTEISGNQNLKEIRILPGRNDALDSFAKFGRPKTLEVTLSDGTTSILELSNEPALQKFPISGTADWVRIEVLDIYPGSESDDTYISEIDFGVETAPSFEPFSGLIAQQAPPATLPAAQSSGATSTSATTPALGPAASTGDPSTALIDGSEDGVGLVWPIVAFAAAAIALAVAIILAFRLRSARGPN